MKPRCTCGGFGSHASWCARWVDPGKKKPILRRTLAAVLLGALAVALALGGFGAAHELTPVAEQVAVTTERLLTVVRTLDGKLTTVVETETHTNNKVSTVQGPDRLVTVQRDGKTVVVRLPGRTVTDTTTDTVRLPGKTKVVTKTKTNTLTDTETQTETKEVDRPTTTTEHSTTTHTETETNNIPGPERTVTETETETDTQTVTDTETVTETVTEKDPPKP